MFNSIRWRIIIPYSLLILVSVAGVGVYMSNVQRQTQLQDLEDRLTDDAQIIGDHLSLQALDEIPPETITARAKHWAELIEARVTIIASDGVVLGESHQDPAQMDNHLNRPEIQQALQEGLGKSRRFSRTVSYDMLYVAVPISQGGEVAGFARVALPLEQIAAQQRQMYNTTLLAALVTTSLAVILSVLIATRVTKPLLTLTQEAQQMTKAGQIKYLATSRRDEVGQLTRAFNALVKMLQNQITALQSEQGKFTAMLGQMTDGVLIVNEDGQITLINAAAERLFNIQADKAIGGSLAEVLRQHQWINLWQRCKETGEEQSLTLELPREGTFIQSIASPLGQALPGHILILFQDLTRIRRLETVRRDFISNISHELRTPLASLKALAETLHSGALEDPPAARRFLTRMERELEALTHMVSELLELTRIESGQVPLERRAVHPRELLSEAQERLGVQAERAGLSLNLACPDDLPEVLVDQPRMSQVLVNLLHNAIKFTPEGGEIRLAAQPQGDQVRFTVQDSGVGIPADDLPRIFERFYKTDRARSGGGTGLGLAIARHLVEAHGGKIWAESVEGGGSTFYFTLPTAG
jgi:two-component system phosphate regulon sensor histidine kinase PhoR